uniref:hypothetical protein n=1 Tax=Marinobacterium profundum TaxID=1714300 RepID=UPI000A6E8899|nr:hypothetical protein [Marinobacterium profundum]
MTEFSLRPEMIEITKSIFERDYSSGRAGNPSLKPPQDNQRPATATITPGVPLTQGMMQ